MPTYTYKCNNCGKVFEKIKSMSANGSEYCEDCNSEAVRVFTPTGIIFKGSGFYTTDYKSGSSKANIKTDDVKKEDKENKKPDTGNETKTEKTVATKEKLSGSENKTAKN